MEPSDSMGFRYVSQFLFNEKIIELLIIQQPLKPEKKFAQISDQENFQVFLVYAKFKRKQILLNKISHLFLVMTKLFTKQIICNGKQSTVNKSLDGSMYPG